MATIAQTIAARHIDGQRAENRGGRRASAVDALEGIALFFATPFLGLFYAAAYGAFGITTVFCYGLKFVGIRCGIFKE